MLNSLLSHLGIFWDFGGELCVGVESPAAGWMTAKSLKCNTESTDSYRDSQTELLSPEK